MGTVTVLIGERLKRFLQIEKTFLARRGFEILAAATDGRAVELARSKHPRLILLEFDPPALDGASSCATMRRDPALATTPIVIVGGGRDPGDRDTCLKAGCTRFVVRPERPAEILGLVGQILSVRQRKVARMSVVFNVAGNLGGRQVVGMAGNLSGTGLLLLAQKLIPAGTLLELEFVIPGGGRTIRTSARVMRASQNAEGTYEIGVHFIDLAADHQQDIVDYVSS